MTAGRDDLTAPRARTVFGDVRARRRDTAYQREGEAAVEEFGELFPAKRVHEITGRDASAPAEPRACADRRAASVRAAYPRQGVAVASEAQHTQRHERNKTAG
ncbi:hypothetical protein [Streptomyces sp. AK02-01A]|uniref:hypothetical protein n=1 Tax=Streptomyces sp. AK02-01A TaxID=3028648 RepID=UPI0029AA8FFB|nr:hypothetical protein [Streptomyces sp. AK02-01A]MDX3853636.1 hypothetical protein [Streptomyces sp. AK02-01A]